MSKTALNLELLDQYSNFREKNIVLAGGKIISTVTGVQNNLVSLKMGNNPYTHETNVETHVICGITVNDEILEYCGFKKLLIEAQNCEFYVNINDDKIILVNFGEGFYILQELFVKKKILFLHELQNLYKALKNHDLKIDFNFLLKIIHK
ncbi:hypothetical protein [Chryseobacterium sp. NKUCC03_KSP]|uniref:hypothetical protein n=1 Tax=Chryseobacterium sp. NKUCC03_KSP TaxID=2842125 RepID=UPI001C5BE4AD|nr:hypothetical protein [Chryseobacterium sp. NKUCC03_KSP]MBW3524336.1 hypothetical protein [Chryseobacterium sp. NKUCC03_KSP]